QRCGSIPAAREGVVSATPVQGVRLWCTGVHWPVGSPDGGTGFLPVPSHFPADRLIVESVLKCEEKASVRIRAEIRCVPVAAIPETHSGVQGYPVAGVPEPVTGCRGSGVPGWV